MTDFPDGGPLVPLILLILVVFIPGAFLLVRWFRVVGNDDDFNTGDMKVDR
jgi:hypothetical protein